MVEQGRYATELQAAVIIMKLTIKPVVKNIQIIY
jgi:hypothetical protein